MPAQLICGKLAQQHAGDRQRADGHQGVGHCGDDLRRLLRPGGSAYLIIPNDYRGGASYANCAHYWKADEASVRAALTLSGLRVLRSETLWLSELGISGAFPSSGGTTGLWHIQAE